MSAPGRSLARTLRSALADFVSSSSPQPIRPRSQVRTPCPPRRPSPPSRGFATWPRPSPFAGLRFAPPRASPRPPPAAPPFASTPRVRHRFPPSISPPRAAPHVPVREPSPPPPSVFHPPTRVECGCPGKCGPSRCRARSPRRPRRARGTRRLRPRVHPPATLGCHSSGAAVPVPSPASSFPPTPWAGRAVIPFRALRRGDVFSARSSPSVADPLHPPSGFEQRPRRTSR